MRYPPAFDTRPISSKVTRGAERAKPVRYKTNSGGFISRGTKCKVFASKSTSADDLPHLARFERPRWAVREERRGKAEERFGITEGGQEERPHKRTNAPFLCLLQLFWRPERDFTSASCLLRRV